MLPPCDSPVPTPPVTLEGVPLQDWDYFGEGGLQVKDDANAEARSADNAAILEMIDNGRWRAVSPDDLKVLTLGDRTFKAQDLKDLLLNLSLAPAESVKTLNLVGYALGSMGLTFYPEFVFVRDSGRLEMTVEPGLGFDIGDLFELMTTGKFAFLGTTVTLTDARRALPPDGVVNVFNMQAPLSEIFVQTLANFFPNLVRLREIGYRFQKELFGAPNKWNLEKVTERFPDVRFEGTREHS